MDVSRTIAETRRQVSAWRKAGLTVGVVPTMGALHQGHSSLVQRSLERCHRTVATVFVNPIQFGLNEDFNSYPRPFERDFRLLEDLGCHLLFAPTVAELFPDGCQRPTEFPTSVTVHGIAEGLCGEFRPGHFAGVATQVLKLFMITMPDVAFFGEKDYQQLQVIRRMVRDLNIPVSIEAGPTIRASDGLAFSSRNAFLSPEERTIAPHLLHALIAAASELLAGAEVETVKHRAVEHLLNVGFDRVEYITLVSTETLEPIQRADRTSRLLAAAWLGRTRLIDNIAVNNPLSQENNETETET
jgi:pantoate--beta-alanine ligase